MRLTTIGVSLTLIAGLLGSGCEMPDGSDPATRQEYVQAIPRANQVAIVVPGNEAARLGSDEPAPRTLAEIGDGLSLRGARVMGELAAAQKRGEFYQITYDVSKAVNGFVFALVAIVKEVDTWPATSETHNSRTWGPWTEALSPITLKFTINKVAPGTMRFSLKGKPKGTPDARYLEILGGRFVGVTNGRGLGDIFIDADAARSLDPEGDGGVGRLDIHWDNSVEPRLVHVTLVNFADRAGDPTGDALYRYTEASDTSGTFEFLVHGDINKDDDPLGQKTRKEKLAILSRWIGSGAGRSDVIITGGDLEWPSLHAQECWDSGFWRTFYTDDRDVAPTEGNPATCVLSAIE